MGYNTTAVIFNDGLFDIENDKSFGVRLVEAIEAHHLNPTQPRTVSAGCHANVVTIVATHPSYVHQLLLVGGNTGVPVTDHDFSTAYSNDPPTLEMAVLLDLAKSLGYSLVKRR